MARALGTLPLLADALAHGQLSYAKVRALTRVATPETEERLLAVGRAGTACHVERIVRGWRRVDRAAEEHEASRRHKSRALAAARDVLFKRESATWTGQNVSAETSMEQQQADALAVVAETALHHGIDPGSPAERYQVVVHVDAAVLADPEAPGQSVLEGGTHIAAETARRLACDATRVVMCHDDEGRIMEVGARTRTIPPALRRALAHRDQGCKFPGCTVTLGQAHHIRHWAQGGPTTLSNLTLLCRAHHRAIHEEGYQVERDADGDLRFRRPNGRPLPDVPPPWEEFDDPVGEIRQVNESLGIHLDAATARPTWLGEPLDVGYAIGVLHPRALVPSVKHGWMDDPRDDD